MDYTSVNDLFLLFLIKTGSLKEEESFLSSSADLQLDHLGHPYIVGTLHKKENEDILIKEFRFNGKRWFEADTEGNPVKGSNDIPVEDKDVSEDDLPLEIKFFIKNLPDNSEDIPKGPQRDYLRKIPIHILEKKYPRDKNKVMYDWLESKEV